MAICVRTAAVIRRSRCLSGIEMDLWRTITCNVCPSTVETLRPYDIHVQLHHRVAQYCPTRTGGRMVLDAPAVPVAKADYMHEPFGPVAIDRIAARWMLQLRQQRDSSALMQKLLSQRSEHK